MTKFACCNHCYHDPVFPLPGHDVACGRESCRIGKEHYTGEEPDRGEENCVFRGMHRSPDQLLDRGALIPCGCGQMRVTA